MRVTLRLIALSGNPQKGGRTDRCRSLICGRRRRDPGGRHGNARCIFHSRLRRINRLWSKPHRAISA